MILEVCCENMESVKAAVEGGADRIELCRDLKADGLTPTREDIAEAVRLCHAGGVLVHVLIRSRAGDFVYNPAEVKQMTDEVRMALSLGADGVVVGALTADGDIDQTACRQWIAAAHEAATAQGCNITFHRAFDHCQRPLEAIAQIARMGCNRILTSGQQPTAEAGVELLKQLVAKSHDLTASGHPLTILCGSGLTEKNAAYIMKTTGATEVHGSLRTGLVSDVEKIRFVKLIS